MGRKQKTGNLSEVWHVFNCYVFWLHSAGTSESVLWCTPCWRGSCAHATLDCCMSGHFFLSLSRDCPSSISIPFPNVQIQGNQDGPEGGLRGAGQQIHSSQDAFVPKWGYDTPGHSMILEHVHFKRDSDDNHRILLRFQTHPYQSFGFFWVVCHQWELPCCFSTGEGMKQMQSAFANLQRMMASNSACGWRNVENVGRLGPVSTLRPWAVAAPPICLVEIRAHPTQWWEWWAVWCHPWWACLVACLVACPVACLVPCLACRECCSPKLGDQSFRPVKLDF